MNELETVRDKDQRAYDGRANFIALLPNSERAVAHVAADVGVGAAQGDRLADHDVLRKGGHGRCDCKGQCGEGLVHGISLESGLSEV